MPAAPVRIAHHVPGRMRIRVHGGKRNLHILDHVRKSLVEADGVTRIEANRDTGSLVVHYRNKSPKQFAEEMAERGRETQTFDLEVGEADEIWNVVHREAEFLATHSVVARSVISETMQLDQALKRATDNALDLKVVVPLGLAVISFLYIGTDIATPLWLSLGVFSFNSFVSLHPPLPYPKSENQLASADNVR
jgi:hypothetical protein